MKIPNYEIVKTCKNCGNVTDHITKYGNTYYTCIVFSTISDPALVDGSGVCPQHKEQEF